MKRGEHEHRIYSPDSFTACDRLIFRTSRRRYGRETLSWYELFDGEKWVEMGDPWNRKPTAKQIERFLEVNP